MVAFVASVVVTVLMVAIIVLVARRRPVGASLTWGEAFVAALFLFMLMFMIYGVVPDRWLQWADSELKWRRDVFFDPWGTGSLFPIERRLQIQFPKEVARDIVATLIYGVGLAGHFAGWLWWQKRGKKAPSPRELTSAYGRPLVKKV